MLSIKNLKQKRFNKKMSHKYVELFKIKLKVKRKFIVLSYLISIEFIILFIFYS